jgi:O-antigen/teichoic acid export membrane protein
MNYNSFDKKPRFLKAFMKDHKKFFHDFSVKLTGSLLGGGVAFLYSIFLMRRLGPSLYGQFSFALGWTALFNTFVDFGLNPIVTRDVAQSPDLGRHYFSFVLNTKLILLVVTGIAVTFAAYSSAKTSAMVGLLLASYFLVTAGSIFETVQAFFYAYEKFKFSSIFFVIQKVFIAAGGLTALYMGYSLLLVVRWSALGGWLGAIGAWVGLWWIVRSIPFSRSAESLRISDPVGKNLLRDAFPVFLYGVLGTLYFRIDTVFLGYMTSDMETGIYGAAYRLFEITNVLPTVFVAVTQATLSKDAKAGVIQASFRRYAVMMVILSLMTLGGLQLVPLILPRVLVHPGYSRCGPLLRILSFTVIPMFMNYLLLTVLTMINKQKDTVWIAGLGLIVNVAANLFAIPRWQATGAATTTLLSEIFVMVLYFRSFWSAAGAAAPVES